MALKGRQKKRQSAKPEARDVEPMLTKLLETKKFNEEIVSEFVKVVDAEGKLRHDRVALAQAIAEARAQNLDGEMRMLS